MKSNWFTNTFLPSMLEKVAQQPEEHKNRIILSAKQAEICASNMQPRECRGNYGLFIIHEYQTDTHNFTMRQQGKYTFLEVRNKMPTKSPLQVLQEKYDHACEKAKKYNEKLENTDDEQKAQKHKNNFDKHMEVITVLNSIALELGLEIENNIDID